MRPRNRQPIVALLMEYGISTGEFQKRINSGHTFRSDSGWDVPWHEIVAWIPERELIQQARAARKVKR